MKLRIVKLSNAVEDKYYIERKWFGFLWWPILLRDNYGSYVPNNYVCALSVAQKYKKIYIENKSKTTKEIIHED